MYPFSLPGLITGQELRSRLYPVDGDIVEVRMVGRHLSSNVAFQASTGDTDKSFQLAYVDKVNISKCQDVRQLITRHPPLSEWVCLSVEWVYVVSG